MGEILLGYAMGAGAACLIWGIGMVIWCVLADKRDERRFNVMIEGTDAGRDKAWRELGISEETIAQYYTIREEKMKDITWH